ncbi:hypothetical protein [Risungbinella massiliensis]|uniref:hypothetical protein n=1 Tax=Risungbinella massiliensis TaxID=1329796 RepID=UPI0005CB8092|nr:hypothetical protein [Risungbinella massiliensis]
MIITIGHDQESYWRVVTKLGRQLIWLPFRYQTREEAEKEIARLKGEDEPSINNIDDPAEFNRRYWEFWEDEER